MAAPAPALAALAGVLSLAACGGGSGAPNNPFEGGVAAAHDHAGGRDRVSPVIPFVFTVTGGTQPYAVLSSDQAALPVAQDAERQHAGRRPRQRRSRHRRHADGSRRGRTVDVRGVTVRPALLLPASITITGNPNCGASGADLCSGQDGTASVQVTGPAGAPLAGRDVRFDVVQGSFSISSTAPGQPLVPSLTVTTDQNGNATSGSSCR